MTDYAHAHAVRYIENLEARLCAGDISLPDYRRKIDMIMQWLIGEAVPPAESEPPAAALEPESAAEEQPTCPTALLTSPFMDLARSGS
jgi:hypothetical protein